MDNFSTTEIGVIGGAILFGLTTLGGLFLFLVKKNKFINKLFDADFFVGFMLSASAFGLIIPAFREANYSSNYVSILFSIAAGCSLLLLFDYFFKPNLTLQRNKNYKAISFFIAMVIHNFPEGLAAGASLSHGQSLHSFSIIAALGLQNIPEGFATGMSLVGVGVNPFVAFCGVVITGIVELAGGLLGGVFNSLVSDRYPLVLAFAGGSMMKVSLAEIIEKINLNDIDKIFNKNFIIGFLLMTVIAF